MNPYADSAQAYLKAGFSPIPAEGKRPLVSGYHGRDGKWASGKTISLWTRKYVDANVAIRLPEGLIGIDVDAYDGKAGAETLEALEKEYGALPPTIKSTARDDGVSGIRLFRIPDGYGDVEWPGKAGPGIDIITWYERYMIVAPSIHPDTGDPYQWYIETPDGWDDIPPAYLAKYTFPILPHMWADALAEARHVESEEWTGNPITWLKNNGGGEPCEYMADTIALWEERIRESGEFGGMHDDVAKAANAIVGNCAQGHIGTNAGLRTIKELFLEFIPTRDSQRNRLKNTEFHGVVKSAVRKRGIENVPNDPCEVLGESGLRKIVEKQRNARLLEGFRTGDWLDKQEFPELRWAVPEILPEGLVVLAGPPKVGKSVLMLKVSLSCAIGHRVFGMDCERRDVFYLALEDSERRMQTRCDELLHDQPIPRRFGFQLKIKPGKLVATVNAWLSDHPNGIVLVDTLGRALERPIKGETTYDRDYRITTSLKDVADNQPGSCIVVSHHSRKASSDDWLDSVSGTNAIAGAADTIIVLNRARSGNEGVLKIAGRDVDESQYAIILEKPDGWRLDGDDLLEAAAKAETVRSTRGAFLSERMTELVEFVNNSSGVNREQVAVALGMSPGDSGTYLLRAYEAGRINRMKRGIYGPGEKIRLIHSARTP